MSLLRLDGVSKQFSGTYALSAVSFALEAHEIHALIGENGAGKSTLVRVLTGAHAPTSGSVWFEDAPVALTPQRALEAGIRVVYQNPAVFPDLTVAENLALARGVPKALSLRQEHADLAFARALLERLQLDLDGKAYVRDLSLAQRQLLEIAKALTGDARLLILDEPTAALSEQDAQRLFQTLRRLRDAGTSILYISHRLEELPALVDRVTVLRDGKLAAQFAKGEYDIPDLIKAMVGREFQGVFPTRQGRAGDSILRVEGLGSEPLGLRAISLEVRAGEVLGIAGLVGAGRSELADVLFGLAPQSAGQLYWCGKKVRLQSGKQARELGMAYVPEDRPRRGVIAPLSVEENIATTNYRELSPAGMVSQLGLRRLADELRRSLSIKAPTSETLVQTLSGGNQQKVVLAKWLAAKPRLILLDEPTQGVDVGAKAEIYKLIGQMADDGLAVILISSEMQELLGLADRIAVMAAGTITGTLERAEATPEAIMQLALPAAVRGAA